MSDDGAHALTLIAMLGNPFSPRYARARALGGADPLEFSVFNVALRGPSAGAWSCTERPRTSVGRTAETISIGKSSLGWDGESYLAAFDERTAPWGTRVRGRVRVTPEVEPSDAIALDPRGEHRWRPLAPIARAEIELDSPRLRFAGRGYVDANAGSEPPERAFSGWTWARSIEPGTTIVSYDVARRDGSRQLIGRAFDRRGDARELADLRREELGRTRWGITATIACDPKTRPSVERRLEDTPFYARSLVSASLGGRRVACVHEALSLTRLERGWVQFLLPFRMRRAP